MQLINPVSQSVSQGQLYTISNEAANFSFNLKSNDQSTFRSATSTLIPTQQGVNIQISDKAIVEFDLPNGAYFDVYEDHSFSIKDASNKAIAAVGSPYNATIVRIDNGTVEYSADEGIGIVPMMFTYNFYDYFSSGQWIQRAEGISLSLVPNGFQYMEDPDLARMHWSWDRVAGQFANSMYWTNYYGLENQYDCHYLHAINKTPWNLEPWRPNVGWGGTVAAQCNP